MKNVPFDLTSLIPRESTFTISGMPDKTLTLRKWSLRVRAWATEKYGHVGLQKVFAEQRINEIAELAWFMLKEKDLFEDKIDNFLEAISSVQDQVNLIKALLAAVGIGEPEIDQIKKTIEKNTPKPDQTEGADPNA